MSNTQFYVSKGQSIKGPHTNVRRVEGRNGQILRNGTAGVKYESDPYNTTPLPVEFVEFAQAKMESNGKSLLDNMLTTGVLVTVAGGQTPAVEPEAMGSELTVNPRSGRITEDK
jgi:hypothetical protein